MSDLYLQALLQSLLGSPGSGSSEFQGLLAEVCRRFILSGISVNSSGVFNLNASISPSSLSNLGAAGVIGDHIYYDSTTTLARLAAVATGKVLKSAGIGVAPAYGQILNADVDPAAAIAYTKLNLATAIVNGDINAAAAIAYSKLNLATAIVNADIAVAAAIAWSKIDKTGSSLADLTTRSASALSSGTVPTAQLGSGSADASKMLTGDQAWTPWDITCCDGRLTLTTATPVTTADVSAAGTVFFTPYKGNRIALYDGTRWKMYTFAEISIAVPAVANQMYDVWAFDSAGSVTLEVLAWTSDTARATALTLQDGVLVKTGATTRRYLGSFRTLSASQTEDSYAKRLVWNYYNRVPRAMRVVISTDSYNYTVDTFREAEGGTANRLQCVIGVAEEAVTADALHLSSNSTGGIAISIAIGEDSTTTPKAGSVWGYNEGAAGVRVMMSAHLITLPAIGFHFYSLLERSAATLTTTWYGDNAGTRMQAGITGVLNG